MCKTSFKKSIQTKVSPCKFNRWLRFLFLSVALTLINIKEAKAVEFPNGTKAFESGVLLLDSHSTFNSVRTRQAIYYFDLELPKDVGESLQKIMIKQRAGGDDIKFRPERTKVYLGDHNNKKELLDANAVYNEDSGIIEVNLDKPVPPGSKFTVGIKPKRNPDYAGVYLFGVTAFPSGKTARGLYLGAGRIHFYRNNDFGY